MTNDQNKLTADEHVSKKPTFKEIAQRHVSSVSDNNAIRQARSSDEVLNMEKISKQEVEKNEQNKLVQDKNETEKNKIQLKNSSRSGGLATKKTDVGNRWMTVGKRNRIVGFEDEIVE